MGSIALHQKQTDDTFYEQSKASIAESERSYRKELFLTILQGIENYVNAQIEEERALIPIGDRLIELGQAIPEFEDTQIDLIQAQLQALRSEPAE
jgi:hypothetical protein